MSEETLLARLSDWEKLVAKIDRETITVDQVRALQIAHHIADKWMCQQEWPYTDSSQDRLVRVKRQLVDLTRAAGRLYGIKGVDLLHDFPHVAAEAWTDFAEAVASGERYVPSSKRSKVSSTKKKRAARGSQQKKIEAWLLQHHEYEEGRAYNYTPASNAEIVAATKASDSTVSEYLNKHFDEHPDPNVDSPRSRYEFACSNRAGLLMHLKVIAKDGRLREKTNQQ